MEGSRTTSSIFIFSLYKSHFLYLGDLQVVELLLPLENVLQSAQPDVDVAHEDTSANVDGQILQSHVQVLQQVLDQARIVVVLED